MVVEKSIPYQARKEEATARLHDQTSPGKDKTNFGVLVSDTYAHWQRHGNANADRTALQGSNNWLPTSVYSQGYPAPAVPVIPWILLAADEAT